MSPAAISAMTQVMQETYRNLLVFIVMDAKQVNYYEKRVKSCNLLGTSHSMFSSPPGGTERIIILQLAFAFAARAWEALSLLL